MWSYTLAVHGCGHIRGYGCWHGRSMDVVMYKPWRDSWMSSTLDIHEGMRPHALMLQADLMVSLHITSAAGAVTCKTLQPQWVATTDMNDCC
jgi:hypothetical protein